VLLVPERKEHSIILWVVSKKPLTVATVLFDKSRRARLCEFRTLLHAAKAVCRSYCLPVEDDELKTLCARGGIVRLSDPLMFLGDVKEFKEPGILPVHFGQSALCHAWRPLVPVGGVEDTRIDAGQSALRPDWRPPVPDGGVEVARLQSTHSSRPMPPRVRKRIRLAPPPKSPPRGAPPSLTYHPSEMGGKQDEVADLLDGFPQWNAEVVHELLHWGATPKLVEVNHSTEDRAVTLVNCTFAQPDGRLVRNVILPLGVLRAEYAPQVAHL
jgi:hypothetical protein